MPDDTLGFLHTLPANERMFAGLMAELAPQLRVRHRVDESLLVLAREAGAQDGTPPVLQRRVGEAVRALMAQGARLVVCTCSTIGGAAEASPTPPGTAVMRIDRPMAEQALSLGPRVLVAAALASTFPPTIALLTETARAKSRPLQLSQLLCEQAWPLYQRGDQAAYARAIAADIQTAAASTDFDVIVLAQASMAPAADLLSSLTAPILSSPRSGLLAAIVRLKSV